MHLHDLRLLASPTDLANFLACRHKTALDLLVAEGRLEKPTFVDPLAAILRERGDVHEKRYVDSLRAQGLDVVEIADGPLDERRAATLAAMRTGADVIVQAALGNDRWSGYADVLRNVSTPSLLGAWSYEAQDTKLARETRGGTILQLCVYSELVGEIQGHAPEHFHVVTPAAAREFRFDDFAAFYRQVKARLWQFVEAGQAADEQTTYPDPVEHCAVCRWSSHCTAQRREDDHLCFVAGLGRLHAIELAGHGVTTLAALAVLPVPLEFSPRRGARETYQRLREQARLQLERRTSGRLVWEALPIDPTCGLSQLPAPGPGDLFLDLEGDPFGRPGGGVEPGEGGREYLFGLGRVNADGSFHYSARWAFTDGEERVAFDEVMTDIMTALDEDPSMHVYHYAAYEASAFKRLAGRYAAREADVDRLLRGGRFVDLYAIVRRALRAGVERYSIKDLEPFYGFVRDVALDEAGDQRRLVEVALEVGDASAVTPAIAATVEGYNKDDCRSTLELRRWLESLRDQQIANGADITRPPLEPGDPSDKIKERDRRAIELRSQLLAAVPGDPAKRTPEERARHLLASLVDWHRCEERFAWGEFHRLREKPVDDLLDEPGALVGLIHAARVFTPPAGGRKKAVVDRYIYPVQENEVRKDDQLRLTDDTDLGTVEAIDKTARTIDIKKRVEENDTHPTTVIALHIVNAPELERSIQRVAESVIAMGLDDGRGDRVVNDLLLARAPRLESAPFLRDGSESATDFAVRAGADLDDSVLAIQGPPGAGKTFTGAKMIAHLTAAGRKVGVVANSHKVIRKLLVDSGKAAAASLPIAHKPGDDELPATAGVEVEEVPGNSQALAWLGQSGGRVLGGTAWMWARPEFQKAADVLFVDEAGQMALANVLAVAPAARSLVLLGDPQQLDQPQRGHHPDGAEVSALDHILGGHQTMPEERGIFLPITYRLTPEVAAFTSEVFYERKLTSKPGLERQRLVRAGRFEGAGLFVVDVQHDGCRNASSEEADAVRAIVSELLQSGAGWTDESGQERALTPADVLVVAPYNAHVNLLQERVNLPPDRIGTVDKFQGQEAPVVIYSMTTSRPEDAPRGMEFLYSLNRLNVATSRARCACILVASPRLFEPECRTPRQMQLANALAWYREMAR
jgi:predicted RecB family nuclease